MTVISERYDLDDLQESCAVLSDVLIIDLSTLYCCEATILDFGEDFCRVRSSEVMRFNDSVALRQRDSEKLIRGWVKSVMKDTLEISFKFDATPAQEKRKEARRPVHIPAKISSSGGNRLVSCVISNAGRSGCRVEADGLTQLTDSINLHIPAFDMPISGQIVWRSVGSAGIKLDWNFTSTTPATQSVQAAIKAKKQRAAIEEAREAEERRANKSGFGPSRKRKRV
ncbi:MAG: PilZ domain-containing protein [Rhodobacteraceae bacterium]|nr:PilZ domain-containing protein [Paracoccaceae bacterium]